MFPEKHILGRLPSARESSFGACSTVARPERVFLRRTKDILCRQVLFLNPTERPGDGAVGAGAGAQPARQLRRREFQLSSS